MLKVYLAGSMEGRLKTDILKERCPIRTKLSRRGFDYIDPFKKEEHWYKDSDIVNSKNTNIRDIVHLDKKELKQCDILLYITGDKPSYGSLMEFCYMRYLLVKPVIAIAPKHRRGEQCSWLMTEADYIADDYKDAINYIDNKFNKHNAISLKAWRDKILEKHGRI